MAVIPFVGRATGEMASANSVLGRKLLQSRTSLPARGERSLLTRHLISILGFGDCWGLPVARHLIYVPVVHSEADMGSMASVISRRLRLRPEQRRARQEKVARFWQQVRASLLEMLDERPGDAGSLSRVRIYQDGLPAAGELASRIARESAAKGSHNYNLVLELLERGATLEQTEDPGLLREEYSMLSKRSRNARRASELLEMRDRFIADRINATLKEGETGVLFIGALHRLTEKLAPDIEVSVLAV